MQKNKPQPKEGVALPGLRLHTSGLNPSLSPALPPETKPVASALECWTCASSMLRLQQATRPPHCAETCSWSRLGWARQP
ncbi:unnamed protein product [Arctogadus glacialis]